MLAVSPFVLAHDADDEMEEPFGAAAVIIRLTDNDIELQVFADAFDWNRLEIFDPRERRIFDTKARGRLLSQGGLTEMVCLNRVTISLTKTTTTKTLKTF